MSLNGFDKDVEPLIYTKNGNVPVTSLTYRNSWQITEDLIIFSEEWHDESGELVKNNVQMYAPKGMPAIGGQQASMQ